MKYKKLIAGVSAILMCAVSIPFANASADETGAETLYTVDDSASTYETGYKTGDSNVDGKTNVKDLTNILKIVAGTVECNYYDVAGRNSDVNCDKEISANDAVLLAQVLTGSKEASEAKTLVQQSIKIKATEGDKIAIYVGERYAGEEASIGMGYSDSTGEWVSTEVKATVASNGVAVVDAAATTDELKIQLYYPETYIDSYNTIKIGKAVEATSETESTEATESTASASESSEASSETESASATETESATEETSATTEATEENKATITENSEGNLDLEFASAVGDSIDVDLTIADGIDQVNGAISASVEVDGTQYWVAFQWATKKSGEVTVEFTTENMCQLKNNATDETLYSTDSNNKVDIASSELKASVVEAMKSMKTVVFNTWYATKGQSTSWAAEENPSSLVTVNSATISK